MTINRKKFFDGIRQGPFRGKLSASAVKTCELILDEWERRKLPDLRQLAYIFATPFGEVGEAMQPVREGFKATDAQARAYVKRRGYPYAKVVNGNVYYGRGLVQLTWDRNYKTMGELVGLDLYNKPDLALDPEYSVAIMFTGMLRGTFTKKKLDDFFSGAKADWTGARKIINGMDRAGEFAGYAKQFFADLSEASK